MKGLVLAALIVAAAGCATANTISEETLPRFGQGLDLGRQGLLAQGEAYDNLCVPEPKEEPLMSVCPKLKSAYNLSVEGINAVGEVYQEVNDKVKAAQ